MRCKESRDEFFPVDRHLVFGAELERVAESEALWGRAQTRSESRLRLFEALHEAIESALTDKQREALWPWFFEGLSQAEIAHRLGISQQVVHKRIFGARRKGRVVGGAIKRLREALEGPFDCL